MRYLREISRRPSRVVAIGINATKEDARRIRDILRRDYHDDGIRINVQCDFVFMPIVTIETRAIPRTCCLL